MIQDRTLATLVAIVITISGMLIYGRLSATVRRRLTSLVAFGSAPLMIYLGIFVNIKIITPAGVILVIMIAAWFVYFGLYNSRHFHLWLTWRVQWVFRGMFLFTVLMFFLSMVTSGFDVAYLAIVGEPL